MEEYIVLNDLKKQYVYLGIYRSDIVIIAVLSLFLCLLIFNLEVLNIESIGLIAVYYVLFSKYNNDHDSLFKRIIRETKFWLLTERKFSIWQVEKKKMKKK